ncbi:hypothetical protein M2128_002289, partial [Polynucleobacter sphagniphilus]|nr:hypothetical protein [Polynucleobacter sphagniphilus]
AVNIGISNPINTAAITIFISTPYSSLHDLFYSQEKTHCVATVG